MLYLERLLQINMATLAALGALMLGMGERSVWTPLLVATAAAASVWLTDVTGWFRLSRRVVNVLMLLAAANSIYELYQLGTALQALGLARYVLCLQIILMFQQKDARTYWVLVIISLLQVVMATLFIQSVWFGVLLVVYMLLGFSAMTLLLMHREWERRRLAAALPAPASSKGRGDAARWPLAGQHTEFASSAGGSSRVGIGRDLFRRVRRMGLQTLAFALLLFFAVPRFEQFRWQSPMTEATSVTGFNETVTLSDTGQIAESRDEVLRVRFYRPDSDVSEFVNGEIYLQGGILTDYGHGRWQPPPRFTGAAMHAEQLPLRARLVQEKITIEGMDRDDLFFVPPLVVVKTDLDIFVDNPHERMRRSSDRRKEKFLYEVATTAIVDGNQMPLVPELWERPDDESPESRLIGHTQDLPKLAELARRWFAESGLLPTDRLGRGTLPGAATCHLGTLRLQPGGSDARSGPRPDRGLPHPEPVGKLRVLRHGADPHAPQPGNPGADGGRLQDLRMELDGGILPGPPVARPHLGASLPSPPANSARTQARSGVARLGSFRRMAAA